VQATCSLSTEPLCSDADAAAGMARTFVLIALLCGGTNAARRGASRPPCPYKELGVAKTASDDDIKRAYKAKALQLHPDKAPPNKRQTYEAKFKRINAAYQKIRDTDARRRHARESTSKPFARPAPPAQELRVPLRVSVEDLLRGATRYAVISSAGFTFLLPVKIEVGMRPGDVVDRKAHGDTILTVVLEQKPGLYRIDGEDLHRSAWLQQWSKPTSLKLRAPGGRFPFLRKNDVVVLPRKGKKWGDGFRLRKKGRGLYAKGSNERGDLVVTVRRRSLRSSIAVLAARLSPLVAVITAIQNRTRTIQQARRARDLAKKHGPGILEGFSSFLAARRVFDDLQRYAGAPATQW
jgi:DnaJ-class molecular chaperone